MPRLILKSPYLKPNAKQHLVNYTQYVATREGVERRRRQPVKPSVRSSRSS